MSRESGYNVRERIQNRFEVDQRAALFGNRARPKTGGDPTYGSQDRDMIEQQNETYIGDLHEKVGLLREVAQNIGREAKSSNSVLDGLGIDFDKAGNLLKGTVSKLQVMMQNKSGKHMCYLVLFVLVLFLLMYFLHKIPSFGGQPTAAPVLSDESAVPYN